MKKNEVLKIYYFDDLKIFQEMIRIVNTNEGNQSISRNPHILLTLYKSVSIITDSYFFLFPRTLPYRLFLLGQELTKAWSRIVSTSIALYTNSYF